MWDKLRILISHQYRGGLSLKIMMKSFLLTGLEALNRQIQFIRKELHKAWILSLLLLPLKAREQPLKLLYTMDLSKPLSTPSLNRHRQVLSI
jgi:hypothetical protein